MATIGNLFVKIGADTKPMEKSLAEAKGRLGQWAASIGGIAMGAGGMLASVLPGDLGAGAARIMSGLQGIANVAQGGSKFVAMFGDSIALLANPFTAAALAATAAGVAIAAVGAAIVMATLKAAKLGDQLKETADELGTTAEGFQRLEYIGTAAGAGPEKIRASITKMQFALASAAQGSQESAKAFERLGLDIGKLNTQDATAAFEQIIGKIRELPTHTEKVKALRDIFGKGGAGLAGMVKLTAEEMEQLNKEAAAFSIREGSVQALASLQDSVDTLGLAFQRLLAEAVAPFAPLLQKVTDGLKELLSQNADDLYQAMSGLARLTAAFIDGLRPAYELLMGILNVLQTINGFVAGVMLDVIGKVLRTILGIVETINLIPGIEIPTAGLESLTGLADKLKTDAFNRSAQDFNDAGDRFAAFATSWLANAKGEAGELAKALEAFEAARKKAAEAPAAAAAPAPVIDPKAIAKAEEVGKIISKLRDDIANVGALPEQMLERQLSTLNATQAQIAEAITLQKQLNEAQSKAENAKQITKTIEDLASKYDRLVLSEETMLELELRRLGATEAQVKAAEDYARAIKDAENANKITAQLEEMRKKVDEFGKSASELAAAQLASLGATQAQIDEAIRLQGELAAMETAANNAAEVERILEDVARAADDAGKSEMELMRRRLEALNATEDQISKALGALRDTQVGNMLRDLEDQAKRATMSERELLEERLRAAGATAEEIAKGLALQDKIDASKEKSAAKEDKAAAAGPDSVQTALGSIKLPGMMSSVRIAEQQLDVQSTSARMLEQIAGATATTSSLMAAAAEQGGSRNTGTMLEDQTLSVLKQIEANTRAFAGVLT
jgi:hypothetical protein